MAATVLLRNELKGVSMSLLAQVNLFGKAHLDANILQKRDRLVIYAALLGHSKQEATLQVKRISHGATTVRCKTGVEREGLGSGLLGKKKCRTFTGSGDVAKITQCRLCTVVFITSG